AHAPRDDGAHAVALGEALTLEEERLVVVEPVRLAQLGAPARAVVRLDEARVGDLAAPGRVERRLAQLAEEEPVLEPLQRADLRQHVRLLEADELGREAGAAGELGGAHVGYAGAGAGALALLRHQPGELLLVDAEPALL